MASVSHAILGPEGTHELIYRDSGAVGLQVTTDLYEGRRHEILNETNRYEVVQNFRRWPEEVPRRQR